MTIFFQYNLGARHSFFAKYRGKKNCGAGLLAVAETPVRSYSSFANASTLPAFRATAAHPMAHRRNHQAKME